MNYLGTAHLIVYAFLLVTLLMGLWAGRGVKNMQDYTLANKMYGTGALTITFLATYIGGSTVIGELENVFTDGVIMSIVATSQVLCILFIALFIAPKMNRFGGSLTMGDMMGALYGKYGQVATGILGFFYTICIVSAQILALGYVYNALLGLDNRWAIALGGLIAVIYAAQGGMRAVTITDIFQFVILVIVIPLIANVVVHEVGSVKELFRRVPADKLQIISHGKVGYYATIALFVCVFNSFLLSPPFISRMLMARNKRQATDMLFIAAAFDPLFKFLIMLIGLGTVVLYPTIEPSKILPHIISEFFPVGIQGLCIAGLIAIIMSTADSFLHAAGLSLIHDVVRPIQNTRIDTLRWVQYATFITGCLSIFLALAVDNIFTMVVYGTGIMGASITFPFIAGVMGIKKDARAFQIALIVTLPIFIATNLLLSTEMQHLVFPISVIVNAIVFLGTHIMSHGGIVLERRNEESKGQWKTYSYTYEPKQVLFALFICFNYMVPYFMYTNQGGMTMFMLKFLGALLCVGLLLQPYWPNKLKRYFDSYWHFCLLYCLPFTTTVLYLLNGGGLEWTVNIALSIMLLLNLVDWKRFMVLLLTGIVLGVLYVRPGSLSYENTHMLVYAITFSTLVGLLFARRKEQHITQERRFLKGRGEAQQASLRQSISENRKVLQALQNTGAGNLLTMIRSLHELDVKKADSAKLEALERDLIPVAFQLQGIDTRSQDYLRLHIQADRPIEELLSAVKEKLQASGIKASIKIANEAQCQTVTGDFEQLVTLLTKSIALLQGTLKEDEGEPVILISLKDTQLAYPLPDVEKDYIKHVPALRIAMTTTEQLPALAPSYSPDLNGSGQMSSEATQELDRPANARIVKAHYGYAETTDDTLLYVIPTDVREVRPRDMDKAYMEVDATPKRANDHYKSDTVDAHTQEAAFLTDVAARSDADLGLVKMALELIKWYHGPSERKSGEPFYLHPLTVAHIVLSYDQDEATIIGALLHDTVEDTPMLLQHIETVFGKDTAEVVDLVTHLQSIEGSIHKIKMSASENLQMLDRAGNKRGLYVKIADRMHNMRTINGHSKVSKRKLIAQETTDFFVPLAKKLGLKEAAQEFEKICEEVFKQKD